MVSVAYACRDDRDFRLRGEHQRPHQYELRGNAKGRGDRSGKPRSANTESRYSLASTRGDSAPDSRAKSGGVLVTARRLAALIAAVALGLPAAAGGYTNGQLPPAALSPIAATP